jgi:[ribosomal protein S5]-alanine N-acetyltransferase
MATTEIRLIEPGDADAIAAHLARDAEAFARWDEGPTRDGAYVTPEGQRRRIDELRDDHKRGVRWPAVVLSDGNVIGQVNVSTILGPPFRKGFLGYWIGTSHQGQGHASRAVGLAVQVMTDELGLHRAEAHTQVDNLASHRVLRNNGFTSWGIAHGHIFIQGEWRDEIFWERNLRD